MYLTTATTPPAKAPMPPSTPKTMPIIVAVGNLVLELLFEAWVAVGEADEDDAVVVAASTAAMVAAAVCQNRVEPHIVRNELEPMAYTPH